MRQVRGLAGISAYPRDSVQLANANARCDAVNAQVLSYLSTAGIAHFSTWDGVALARIGPQVYLADPIQGDGIAR